jgi:hypothetical protein
MGVSNQTKLNVIKTTAFLAGFYDFVTGARIYSSKVEYGYSWLLKVNNYAGGKDG